MLDLKPGDKVTLTTLRLAHPIRAGELVSVADDRGLIHPIPWCWLDLSAPEPVMAGEWYDSSPAGYSWRRWEGQRGGVAAEVGPRGWNVWMGGRVEPEHGGPETGQQGRDKADACLRAAGHLPPLPAWVPKVGDLVDASNMGIGRVVEARVCDVGLLYYVRLNAGGAGWWAASYLRPAPQPERKVALGWCDRVGHPGSYRPQAIGTAPGQVPGAGAGHVTVEGVDIAIPPHQVERVQRAYCDAHLIARGYTLEGGPVEGVQVVCRWRPGTTVEQIRALRTSLRERLKAEGTDLQALWLIPISGSQAQVMRRHWATYAAWLIQHPEAPIEWSIHEVR